MAEDRARIAISTSWSMPNETSWASVRNGPVRWARVSSRATPGAALAGHTVASGLPWARKCPGR